MARAPDEMEDAVEPGSGETDSSSRPTIRCDDVPPHQIDTMQRIGEMVRRRLSAAERRKERIGRYLVLEEVGRGGMGVVYAAYDEQLDRKVAVKVLLDDALGTEDERLRALREAQALARLNHPNVVTIHEVGEDDGQFFLAMEFVRGQNLSTWLETAPPWRQVLEVFVDVGRGLAAAHDAGLVHRDLKPANIVRSSDGAVKVLDFGLARGEEAQPESEDFQTSNSALSMRMTRTGALMGTPAYMAPEHLMGEGADPRSDQYGFCLALWEGLTGARPFAGSTLGELLESRLAGSPAWPSSAPPVPRPIIAALIRGLSVQPEDRWPSMQALLTVLAWDPDRRRTRRWLAAATVGMLGLGGVLVHDRTVARDQPCHGSAKIMAEIWDDARRVVLRSVIEDDERPYTRTVWSSTDEILSTYADTWASVRTEACEATIVRGEQSPHLLDLRMRCLDHAAMELEAVVDTLSDAGDEVASRALQITDGLPPLSRCSDAEALEADVEPPLPSETQAVEDVRRLLAQAKSLRLAARYDEAQVALESASAQLEDIGYEPLRTEVAHERGKWLRRVGDYEDAYEAFSEAAELAMKWQQRPYQISALVESIQVLGVDLLDPERAMVLWPLLRGVSGDDPIEYAMVLTVAARTLRRQGKNDEAITMYDEAMSLIEANPEAPPKVVAVVRSSFANALRSVGRLGEAEAEIRVALDDRIEVLGPAHPDVGHLRTNLALVLEEQGKHEEAQDQALQAVLLQQAALRPGHPIIMKARLNYTGTLRAGARYEEAEEILREILSAASPKDLRRPEFLIARHRLAATLQDQDEHEEALVQAREAVTMATRALGPDSPRVAGIRRTMASVLMSLGRHEEAESELRWVLNDALERLGPDHPETVLYRIGLAEVLYEKGQRNQALPVAERAWSEAQGEGIPAGTLPHAAFVFARILWDAEGEAHDRVRARELGETARDGFRSLGEPYEGDAEEVRDWLDEHPLR